MSSNLYISLIILTIGWTVYPVNCALNKTCPASCSTSIFSLTNDTRHVECTGGSRANCAVSATFRVTQRGPFDEAINLTVIGYGLRPGFDRSVSFVLHNLAERIEYSCSASKNREPQAKVIQGSNSTFLVGTAQNVTGTLICSWTFVRDDFIWPTHANYSKINLIDTLDYQISLKSNDISKVVAWNLAKLPIYRMNFLRCCYKAHGGSDYLFISHQTAQDTNFYLQAFPPIPKFLTATLINPKGGEFKITCNSSNTFNASVKVGSRWAPMKDLRFYEIMKKEAPIPDFRCLWSQPLVLVESSGSIDTRNGRYNLEISSDGRPVYRETTIALNGSSYPMFASLSLIIICVLFQLIV